MIHRLRYTMGSLNAIALLFSFSVSVQAVTCPVAPETKVGLVENLTVDGWFVYHKSNDGIYKAGLKTWKTTAKKLDPVAKITDMDLSPDGKWILFSTGATCYVMKSDGTAKTTVPTTISTGYNQGNAVFMRKGPYGDEIVYNKTNSLEAIRVDLSGAQPTFGTKRLIARDITGKDPKGQMSTFNGTIRVNGNHIYARIGYTGRHVTIPDAGKGIATNGTMHPAWEKYGCGLAMSPDGKTVLTNAAGTMDECGPAQHKGFIVGKFMEYNTYPEIKTGINWVVSLSTSINWCPKEYRGDPILSYSDLEFQTWSWSNHPDYITGEQHGSISPVKDIWVVNRTTNVWTRVTSGNVQLSTPVLWVDTAPTPARSGSAAIKYQNNHADSRFSFGLDGRRIATTPAKGKQVSVVIVSGSLSGVSKVRLEGIR